MFEWDKIINSTSFLSLSRYLLNMRNLVILLIFVSCALSVVAGKCRTKFKILSSDSECEGGEIVSWSWLVTAPPLMKTFYIGEWWGVM